MPNEPPQPHDELTDEELDATLAAGDAQLLEYVRTHANPARTLETLLEITGDDTDRIAPATLEHVAGLPISPRTDPAGLIAQRMQARNLIVALDRADDVIDMLDTAFELTALLGCGQGDIIGTRAITLSTDLDRAIDRALGIDPGRGSYLALARDFTRASDPDRALIIDLKRARALVSDLITGLTRYVDLDLNLVLALARDLDHVLVLVVTGYLARASSHARDLDVGRARPLAGILARTRGHARNLDLDLDLDLKRARARALALALADARDLARNLSAEQVNASGADLSDLSVPDLELLVGVVWDDDTRWAPGLRERVTACSEEISPGVYRVVSGGTERDPHTMLSF